MRPGKEERVNMWGTGADFGNITLRGEPAMRRCVLQTAGCNHPDQLQLILRLTELNSRVR